MPVDLAPELTGHEVETVGGLGWEGITNSELLRRARGQFDALVTMDQNLPSQQHLAARPTADDRSSSRMPRPRRTSLPAVRQPEEKQ